MTYHKDEIRRLNTELLNFQEVADPKAIKAAEEKRAEAEPELSEVLEANAYERHLTSFVADEVAALASGDRGEAVCDCPRPTCPLKLGQLPPAELQAGDLDQGIRRYQHSHVGDAVVLDEAREAFMEKCGRVKSVVREAVGIIKQDEFEAGETAEAET